MSLWIAPRPLILASQSRTRQELLTKAGIPVVMIVPDIGERLIEASLKKAAAAAGVVARHLARAKAAAVSRPNPDDVVLGADQVLVLDGRLFAKPSDRMQAAAQLDELSGRTHHLHSAFCLIRDGEIVAEDVAVATLTMRRLGAAFIDRYLDAAGQTIFGCVGAYQLEGLGIHLFERVEGDHSTILGLPLLPVLAALRRQGVLAS
jgi:septum formation protein